MPTLSDIGRRFDPMREFIQQTQEGLNNLNNQLGNTRQQVHQNTTAIQQMIEMLTQTMNGLREQVGQVVTGMNNLSSASSRSRQSIQQEAATMDDLWAAYRKMGVEVDELNLNLKTLTLTEKEINKVVQLGTSYNKQRADSYTALSEKYRAVKILIDNMTVAERENTQEGRNFVAMAREMYEQMNLLQQKTGKYQLQVGDYSKAMTGLNIATNQVVRELPVLANGVSMFAIAISNNIPILVDNIVQVKRANAAQIALKEELLATAAAYEAEGNAAAAAEARTSANSIKTTSVIQGLAKAVFSWQTAIVLVLTVLPGLIRNIEKKKKAQQEATSSTKEAIEYEKLLAKAYEDTGKEQVRSISRLETLYYVTQDTLRSYDDRIKAAKILKEEYKEEFANLSEEEILLGNAKTAYDNLTKSLLEQAKARAYLNKITELYEKMIEAQAPRDIAKAKKDAADADVESARAALESAKARGLEGEELIDYSSAVFKATQAQSKANSEFIKTDSALQDIDNAIFKLRSEIPVDGLVAEIVGGRGKKSKTDILNLPDYYFDALMAAAEALQGPIERELAILEAGWMKEQQGLLRHIDALNKMRETANAEEREEIKQQTDYVLFLLNDGWRKYEEEQKRILKEGVEKYAEEVVDDPVWEELPQMITKKLRRGRKYGGIVEAILAQTKQYGEGNKFGQGILKEEYVNFVTSVDQALKTSMGFMDEWMDKRLEMAKIAVEAAEKEVEAAQKVLDYEMEARANGYANRVETARKELDLEREQHRKALEEQKRLQEQQLLFDSISQTSSLITATANIWEAMTKGTGLLGPALAVAATALMWGSFAASKIKAKQLADLQAEQYGEGTVELLEGGSHASGHDIDLGTKKDGTKRRAEGGEFFAVINKRNSRKYRSIIPDVINSFNDGTFGERYQRANQAMGNFAMGLLTGNSPTDVSSLERDVRAIREQGDEHRYVDSKGNTIIRYKNMTRKITNR